MGTKQMTIKEQLLMAEYPQNKPLTLKELKVILGMNKKEKRVRHNRG